MTKNHNAFFSVLHKGAIPYLNDFFTSIAAQTRRDFDLVLIDSGIPNLAGIIPISLDCRLVVIPQTGSIPRIWQSGIQSVLELGYANVIFGDSDDFFMPDRVSISLKMLDRGHDFVVHDVALVDPSGQPLHPHYISHRVQPSSVISHADLIEKNFCGFSNSAVATRCIPFPNFPEDLIAVDWYFFSTLALRGAKGTFNSHSLTSYRQHSECTVGLGTLDLRRVRAGVHAKAAHYLHLREQCKEYDRLSCQFQALDERLNDPAVLHRYHASVMARQRAVAFPLWWETLSPTLED